VGGRLCDDHAKETQHGQPAVNEVDAVSAGTGAGRAVKCVLLHCGKIAKPHLSLHSPWKYS
jgi:hypothetical protein